MKRLLFAAARGARIEKQLPGFSWCQTCLLPSRDDAFVTIGHRIHPDDEHLQYGPISSALYEMATGDYEPSEYVFAASGIANYLYPRWQYQWGEDRLHRSLFLLFLAEALADEGL